MLGRIQFVYGALVYDRPFFAPLYTFMALHPPGVVRKLPLYVLIVFRWLLARIRERRVHPVKSRSRIERALLRVDAKAEGVAVAVGGWAPHYDASGKVVVGMSRWFSVRLTEATAPWAFVKGVPAQAIDALALISTTLGLVLLAPPELRSEGTAGTDAVTGPGRGWHPLTVLSCI